MLLCCWDVSSLREAWRNVSAAGEKGEGREGKGGRIPSRGLGCFLLPHLAAAALQQLGRIQGMRRAIYLAGPSLTPFLTTLRRNMPLPPSDGGSVRSST